MPRTGPADYPRGVDRLHADIGDFWRRQRLPREAAVLVAVSGGADSMALLHALAARGQPCTAVHVHHGLRGAEADADARFVRERAAALGVPVHVVHVDAARRDGRSPEARARELRYAALERQRRASGCDWIATAHTLDDQAETLLLRAVRGTGPAGLAGIEPLDPGRRLLRPLLGVRRAALRAYLRRRGLAWREDASNADRGVPRNRLRLDVLPVLEQVQPGAAERLAALAAAVRADVRESAPGVDALLRGAVSRADGGSWLALDALTGAAPALVRAVLLALWRARGPGLPLARRHVEALEQLATSRAAAGARPVPGDWVVVRDADALWLGPAPGPLAPPPLDAWLALAHTLECPERGVSLSWRRAGEIADAEDAWAPPAGVAGVRVRGLRPGDRWRPAGGRERSLARSLQRAGWPRRRRAAALVVEHDGAIAWVPGLGAATPGDAAGQEWQLVARRLSTPGGNC